MALIWKLLVAAEQRFRTLDALDLLPGVFQGARYDHDKLADARHHMARPSRGTGRRASRREPSGDAPTALRPGTGSKSPKTEWAPSLDAPKAAESSSLRGEPRHGKSCPRLSRPTVPWYATSAVLGGPAQSSIQGPPVLHLVTRPGEEMPTKKHLTGH